MYAKYALDWYLCENSFSCKKDFVILVRLIFDYWYMYNVQSVGVTGNYRGGT